MISYPLIKEGERSHKCAFLRASGAMLLRLGASLKRVNGAIILKNGLVPSCSILLWKEYIEFLWKRQWDFYFKKPGTQTVYWNYDLKSLIERHVLKASEQLYQDLKPRNYQEFSEYRLLGEDKSIISDGKLITDWKLVITSRDFRSQIMNYIGGNANHYKMKENTTLIINSGAVTLDEGVAPQKYQRGN